GDREALEQLLTNELPALRAFVRLRAGAALRERESVSDLVQSTCREVLAKLPTFHYGGDAGFRNWLYTAALRKILGRADHWATQKRDPHRELPPPSNSPTATSTRDLAAVYATLTTPSQHAIALETLSAVEAAFDRLPPDRREIIVLSRLVGLDHAALAHHLGCTEPTARQRLFRALAELGEHLGPTHGAD
ncbi:MAG TPA: sigma-70 family RNA polymerase sigma factor, partial [Planctomycetota bacterium]|nr:sigma-70 family RNA polymerase sigma factor [Planctomycetota bacterium]